jgi:probable phosphoglycerate mutase
MARADRPRPTLLLVRHGPTAWNAEGRIQGHSDIGLSPQGEAAVVAWRLPAAWCDGQWYASPLARARRTAALLGHAEALAEPRLIEANWGQWEGERLSDLRARLGTTLVEEEARGLDFRPPGGESPRDLQQRVTPFLHELARLDGPAVAVTHKGIIRAIYALARGWDMHDDPPDKLKDEHAHLFELDREGAPRAKRLNLPLRPGTGDDA